MTVAGAGLAALTGDSHMITHGMTADTVFAGALVGDRFALHFEPGKNSPDDYSGAWPARQDWLKGLTDEQRGLMGILEKDPATALNERWDEKGEDYCTVFLRSFTNPNVHYSAALLEKIYEEVPAVKTAVFKSRACSAGFLEANFPETYDLALAGDYEPLINIVSNANAPAFLVRNVANSDALPSEVTQCARTKLVGRMVRESATSEGLDNLWL